MTARRVRPAPELPPMPESLRAAVIALAKAAAARELARRRQEQGIAP